MSSCVEYGCIFCRTGKEREVAEKLENDIEDIRAIVPEKLRYRRNHGIAHEERVVLFPGYVFFSTTELDIAQYITDRKDVYKLLTDGDGSWQLKANDRILVELFFSTNGIIGLSKAYYEGERIRIKEGFLKQYEGNVLRVNHRAKTAQIGIILNGVSILLWVGFELIE